ncbi:nuclear transport factor 2 family protein [Pseudoduganella violaceinigra]|uniref:nuclear transport factor 2 family protein n=1 Tax=Pseudoduganella violaceinigra TaxID=246602 RepID=UPI000481D1CA|nr:nuclear transport factor 2 family protein [Pseudoduganella violaceinigra]
MDYLKTIEPYEEALRTAMLSNDVDALETLLDDALIFIGPTGDQVSKSDDLFSHRKRRLKLQALSVLSLQAVPLDTFIFTAMKAALVGHFDSMAIDGTYAYTRLWKRDGERWRIVAGQVARVG